jgi:hypothetical protein
MNEINRPSVPPGIVASLSGDAEVTIARMAEEPIMVSSGAATGGVVRCVGELRYRSGRMENFSLIRKTLRPLTSGRHAAFANDPDHWAYWRRELLAYDSDILPPGPGLVAPRCFGTDGDNIYLEDVSGSRQRVDLAAKHLATWQSTTSITDLPWLTRDQLGQRVSVTSLDWRQMDVNRRVVDLWRRRDELLNRLADLPCVISHGDYDLDNMIARGDETVALDWGTLGIAPVGSDLAYLALSALADPTPYFLDVAGGHWSTQDVMTGFQATLALVGSSRVHWMLSGGRPLPAGYTEFVLNNEPE